MNLNVSEALLGRRRREIVETIEMAGLVEVAGLDFQFAKLLPFVRLLPVAEPAVIVGRGQWV